MRHCPSKIKNRKQQIHYPNLPNLPNHLPIHPRSFDSLQKHEEEVNQRYLSHEISGHIHSILQIYIHHQRVIVTEGVGVLFLC
jgi:hypothetical protein